MISINKATIMGFLGEVRDYQGKNGSVIVTCSLATSESKKDKMGIKHEKTEWHKLVFFAPVSHIAKKYLKKGQLVYAEGALQTNKFEKNGVTHYNTQIVVKEFKILSKIEKDNIDTSTDYDEFDL